METDTTQPSWLKRNWKWLALIAGGCLGTLLACLAFAGLIVAVIFGAIRSSDVYQQALEQVQTHPDAVAALGEPIQPGFFVTGSIEINGPSGTADIAIPVKGPQGAGTLYAVAAKSAGRWRFTTLDLAVKGSSQRIDLLANQ